MKTTFRRLVRFEASDGTVKYGEAAEHVQIGDSVQVYQGDQPWELTNKGETAIVTKVGTRAASMDTKTTPSSQ